MQAAHQEGLERVRELCRERSFACEIPSRVSVDGGQRAGRAAPIGDQLECVFTRGGVVAWLGQQAFERIFCLAERDPGVAARAHDARFCGVRMALRQAFEDRYGVLGD